MKAECEIVVVIPVGAGTRLVFVTDTIDSIYYYLASPFQLIIADDSGQALGEQIKQQFPAVHLITNARPAGRYGNLYLTLCRAYRYAVENYRFTALLKIDTDALVIGSAPEKEAVDLFASHPDVGMAGQYGIQYNGEPSNLSWSRNRLVKNLMTWKFIRRPVANRALKKHYRKAVANGYITGESVFGGSYFMSEACLLSLYHQGLLPDQRLRRAALEEDHIFSLLVKAAGYQLCDLSAGSLPFGCRMRGLPDSPGNLLLHGKRIVHSTRCWNGMDEVQIRAYFCRHRKENHHREAFSFSPGTVFSESSGLG